VLSGGTRKDFNEAQETVGKTLCLNVKGLPTNSSRVLNKQMGLL
jgi:hypothetical protein